MSIFLMMNHHYPTMAILGFHDGGNDSDEDKDCRMGGVNQTKTSVKGKQPDQLNEGSDFDEDKDCRMGVVNQTKKRFDGGAAEDMVKGWSEKRAVMGLGTMVGLAARRGYRCSWSCVMAGMAARRGYRCSWSCVMAGLTGVIVHDIPYILSTVLPMNPNQGKGNEFLCTLSMSIHEDYLKAIEALRRLEAQIQTHSSWWDLPSQGPLQFQV
ncbi:hypothetical protein DM860_015934 [Cuscuta australis]|uniref:Uncharacterized protein n=1 Tax=Cuscuta australis TaxID=267555 RepID=A0A328DYH7_9ASTE|nr:hypothetical protein DM860_015934 [Cuscuta australis]